MACDFIVLATQVDERQVGADRIAGDSDAFDQLVRQLLHDVAIFEGARLALIGIADQVVRPDVLGDEAPLDAGGEAGAAAPAQARALDHVDDLVRRIVFERLAQAPRSRHAGHRHRYRRCRAHLHSSEQSSQAYIQLSGWSRPCSARQAACRCFLSSGCRAAHR